MDINGKLPNHVCVGVARATVVQFVQGRWHPQERTEMAEKVWKRLLDNCYPMPLGFGIYRVLHVLTHEIALEQAMQTHPIEELMERSCKSGMFNAWDIFRDIWDLSKGPALNLSPLLGYSEGTESGPVGLVVGRGVPGGYVALFGTSECYRDGEQIAYYFGEPRLKCEIGSGPLGAAVKAGKELQDWYRKTLLGQRVAGGRPKWTGTFSSGEECRAALLTVLHVLWKTGCPLTQRETASYLQHQGGMFAKVDERQIVRWVARLGTTWSALKADALTE